VVLTPGAAELTGALQHDEVPQARPSQRDGHAKPGKTRSDHDYFVVRKQFALQRLRGASLVVTLL